MNWCTNVFVKNGKIKQQFGGSKRLCRFANVLKFSRFFFVTKMCYKWSRIVKTWNLRLNRKKTFLISLVYKEYSVVIYGNLHRRKLKLYATYSAHKWKTNLAYLFIKYPQAADWCFNTNRWPFDDSTKLLYCSLTIN